MSNSSQSGRMWKTPLPGFEGLTLLPEANSLDSFSVSSVDDCSYWTTSPYYSISITAQPGLFR